MCIESVLWFEQRTDRWPRYHQFGLAVRSTEMNCLLLIASHWICECDSEFRWTRNRNINRNKQQSTGTNLSERSPLFSGSWCPTERFHNKEALWHRWHRSKAHTYYIQKGTINMAQMKMLCIFAIHYVCIYNMLWQHLLISVRDTRSTVSTGLSDVGGACDSMNSLFRI